MLDEQKSQQQSDFKQKKIYLRFKKCQRHRISKNLSLHHIVFLTNVLQWFDTVG